MPKRRKVDDGDDDDHPTPRKRRRDDRQEQSNDEISTPADTPSGPKSILKETPSKSRIHGIKSSEVTPSSLRKVLFSTPRIEPVEGDGGNEEQETPTATRNDRSARRKSQRTLQKQITGSDSEDEDNVQDEAIAAAILGEDEIEDYEDMDVKDSIAVTPSKTGRPRGRPKGRRRERTPSPPPNLPPHELYFFQNRTGGNKTSANTLPSQLLLNHEDYYTQITSYKDPHTTDIQVLKLLHNRAFDQYMFELDQGFNLCFYGYGSKRNLLMELADHIHHHSDGKSPKIVIVNGYTPGLTIRDVLTSLSGEILPKNTKLPAQPPALLDLLLTTLTASSPPKPIHLLIHSLDHPQLRKSTIQSALSILASHPSVSLIASTDIPNFPLLWDITTSASFNFLFHDLTTFSPYTAELVEAIEDVNTLLGRSSRRLGGKDGVGYVLKSLPENARSLFRILVAEQLAVADTSSAQPQNGIDAFDIDGSDMDDSILGASDDEEAAAQHTPSRKRIRKGRPDKSSTPKKAKAPRRVSSASIGVEYRTLYHRAVEEFVCSSEVNFRTLLKEFHDHQMIQSQKDGAGTERLSVPFGREELEGILEELV